MKTSSYILIPATSFGSAQENYNGIDSSFSGIPAKAAAYYSKDKDTQTVSWFLSNFVGVLTIEATLDEDNATTNYITLQTIGDGITPVTGNDFANMQGNYTWIRASVSAFTAGTISKVAVGY